MFCILSVLFMPPNSKKLTGHIDFGLCIRASVRSSRTVHARVLKFHIWIPHGKVADTRFFCSSYRPFWSYSPLKKSERNLMHARVLKFHVWIPHGKIADPYFFLVRIISLSSVMPLWKKKSEWNLVSKISRKVFELGAWNLSDRG